MKTIIQSDYENFNHEESWVNRYYKPQRWNYMKVVCDMVSKMPDNLKVLELGAFYLPIVPGSDVI